MPRPTPIVIPGPVGMGGSTRSTQVNIPVADIMNLITAYKQRQANEQGAIQMAKMLGLDKPAQEVSQMPGGGMVNLPTETPVDIESLARSPKGQDLLYQLAIGRGAQKTGQKGTEKPYTEVLISPEDNKPHTYIIDTTGNKIDLGLSGDISKAGGKGPDVEERILSHIERGGTLSEGQTAVLKTIYELKRAGNPLATMLLNSQDLMNQILPKSETRKPEVTKKELTPELASDYLKKYGNRKAAEDAARKDGYKF